MQYFESDLLDQALKDLGVDIEGHVVMPPADDPGFPEDGGRGASWRYMQWMERTMAYLNAQMNLATVVERNDLKKKLSSIQEIVR